MFIFNKAQYELFPMYLVTWLVKVIQDLRDLQQRAGGGG